MLEQVRIIQHSWFHKKDIENLYHNLLLENAMASISNKTLCPSLLYAEEFLANTLYLLELGLEQEARVQFDMVEYLFTQSPYSQEQEESSWNNNHEEKQTKLPD